MFVYLNNPVTELMNPKETVMGVNVNAQGPKHSDYVDAVLKYAFERLQEFKPQIIDRKPIIE